VLSSAAALLDGLFEHPHSANLLLKWKHFLSMLHV